MPRPNIVLILIDDLGWKDLGCSGSTFYQTPNLDRLAAEGRRYTQAYSACPVCSPSRAAILSGRHPARVGITQYIGGHSEGRLRDVPYLHWLPRSEISIASLLKDAGYQTWHVGKWHLGEDTSPTDHGFEVNRGGCGWGAPRHGYISPYRCPTLTDGPPGEHLTDRLTDEALHLLRQRDPSRPFFLNLWHYAVHIPIQAPVDLVERYRRRAQELGLDTKAVETGECMAASHLLHTRVQRRLQQSDPAYAAMMHHLDDAIGRLLHGLEEAGVAKDTLVVFTSDNGGLSTAEGSPTCNLPLREGKGWLEEGGVRVPFLVRWPGVVPTGSVDSSPVVGTDLAPTFLAAAGCDARHDLHCDGVNLLPCLSGDAPLMRDAIMWHYPHYSNQGGTPASSIRSGEWKLIEWFEDGRQELYHLGRDEQERDECGARHPEVRQALVKRLAAWRQEIEALTPKPNPHWEQMRAAILGDPAHI